MVKAPEANIPTRGDFPDGAAVSMPTAEFGARLPPARLPESWEAAFSDALLQIPR